jgi:hypothetical protein
MILERYSAERHDACAISALSSLRTAGEQHTSSFIPWEAAMADSFRARPMNPS